MSSQGLQILNLVQGCIQVIFWYVWLVRLVRLTPECSPPTLAIWSAVLLMFSAVPLSFLIVGLVRTYQSRPHTLWLGLGCTIAAFLSNTVMVRVSDLRIFTSGINQALALRNHMVWLPDLQARTFQILSSLPPDLPICCWLDCVSCGDAYGGI
jgi:hypothetical protein